MKVYDAASIRNVALVGHSESGKTQLTSAILSDSGTVNRFGKVDEGTTVTDFDEEEVARKHTLSASLAYAEWNKQKINLIDAPGMGNFFADTRAALQVADAALVVVDAVAGVMVQTEKVWNAAEELGLPRLVVLNRLDRERASLDRSLQSLREACNRTVIPIQLPIGEEKNFKGVVDLISKKAFVFQTDASGRFSEAAVPADMAAAAFVWKTIADPFAGRITMFRVVSGSLKADSNCHNKTRDTAERFGHLLLLQGKTQTSMPEIKAGDLGAVAKLKDTLTNDTLGDKSDAIAFPPVKFPEPVLSYAIEPKSRGDEDKISSSMHRLEEEDPSIKYSRDAQTKELLLSGQGQLHIEVTVAKLKRRFGVDVNLKPPRIPYRETIKASTEAHGRHKKQTGGHGQFGDCKIRVEPLHRGADFEFVDDIFGGSIPRQFVPAVEKGIQDARTRGYLAGYPMVDFRVTVFDGSYHDVDSNELSFKLAGSLAFKDAMTRAKPTILEPIMNVEVYAPSDYAGDLMGDLNGRRGRIAGMDPRGATTIIKAQVPMAEMLTYEQHLTSATGGRGSYHMEYSHYDEVPAQQQAKIIAAAKAERAGVEVEEV